MRIFGLGSFVDSKAPFVLVCALGSLKDGHGELSMLLLDSSGAAVSLKIEPLGRVNIPSAIAYLDDGVIFVGSTYGDSQLVKLSAEPTATGSYTEILESYSNVGPIIDMCVVDLDKQGQSQVVTCSGAYENGSLRVVRNGIGINEMAELEMPGIQGIWSLKDHGTELHTTLALSLSGQTAFLAVGGEELEGIDVPGASTSESLLCSDVAEGCWVQVVNDGVYLIDSQTGARVAEWTPPDQKVSFETLACSYSPSSWPNTARTPKLILEIQTRPMFFLAADDKCLRLRPDASGPGDGRGARLLEDCAGGANRDWLDDARIRDRLPQHCVERVVLHCRPLD